ncbi:MAG: SDR family NAD(P)-dependent oxidoreductase [Bacteriovoracia bacterium]
MKILVIGGTGEIGRELVKHLRLEHHEVAFSFCRNREEARNLEALGAKGFELNLLKPWDLKAGHDAIVYAAQIDFKQLLKSDYPAFKTAEETTPEFMHELYKIRVEAPFLLIKEAKRLLNEKGQILFLNTLDGVKTQTAPVFYSQCQASLKGLVESAAHELGEHGILVNQLCMGIVEGKVSQQLPRGLKDKYLKHCSLGRYMKPNEVAELVHGMLTYNTYITGESVVADGAL